MQMATDNRPITGLNSLVKPILPGLGMRLLQHTTCPFSRQNSQISTGRIQLCAQQYTTFYVSGLTGVSRVSAWMLSTSSLKFRRSLMPILPCHHIHISQPTSTLLTVLGCMNILEGC